MNVAAHHPLFEVKSALEEIVQEGDASRLAEMLSGRHLPALGGNSHPADIVHRALSLPPYDPALPDALAGLTASLCAQRARELREDLEVMDDEIYVFNLLLFASYLPPNAELFDALLDLHEVGPRIEVLAHGTGRVARQLRQALTYQQTDDRLANHWTSLIDQAAGRLGRLTSDQRSDLVDAWTGLLWIPPNPAQREAGETVDVDRLVDALLKLEEVTRHTTDELSILRHAVRRLNEAYPRSPEFWSAELSSRLPKWPETLRDVVVDQWPLLKLEEVTELLAGEAGKADIVDHLVNQLDGLTKKQAGEAFDGIFDYISQSLVDGDRVQIPGFGTFQISDRKARQGLNPKTKQPITIPASKSVRFKPGKGLKDTGN